MQIRLADFTDPQVQALVRLHLSGMHAASPPGTSYALDLSGLQAADIDLFVAWIDGCPAGMGALKALGGGAGEIKSMRTHPDFRGRGVGQAVLDHLLALARARGYARVSLETGVSAEFDAALALYRRYGFRNGPLFGGYEDHGANQFLHLEL